MNRILLPILLITSLFAKEKTFVREYTYDLESYDTKETARAIALSEVKNILLEEVGIFVIKEVDWVQEETIINGQYNMKDVYEANTQSITAGVTKTTILDETWTDDLYLLKAEIIVDPDDIRKKIKKLVENKEQLKELKEVRQMTEDAYAEIHLLKQQLALAKTEIDQLKLVQEYKDENNKLSAIDWYEKGIFVLKNEESEEAIPFFLKAVELNPNYAVAYQRLGSCYLLINNKKSLLGEPADFTKAIDFLIKAIELEHNVNAFDYHYLGYAYSLHGDNTKAIHYFEKSIELDPNYSSSFQQLAYEYSSQGDYEKAAKYFEKYIEMNFNPKSFSYLMLGRTYRLQGKYFFANLILDKAIELAPVDDIELTGFIIDELKELNDIYQKDKNYVQSIKICERALELEPDKWKIDWIKQIGWGYTMLSDLYLENIDPRYPEHNNKAIEYFTRCIQIEPQDGYCLFMLGRLINYEDEEKSIDYLQQSARLGNKDAQDWLKEDGHTW